MKARIAGHSVALAADITEVREVSLAGSADWLFWQDYLAPEGLVPLAEQGSARIQLMAIEARFKGIPFRELSLAVHVSRWRDYACENGVYLMTAFNSLAAFAWIERKVFHAPYLAGQIEVEFGLTAGFGLSLDRAVVLQARMAGSDMLLAPVTADWEGPVFLPSSAHSPGRLFLARLTGTGRSRPFLPQDQFLLEPTANVRAIRATRMIPGLLALAESAFRPETWTLREQARHSKSETLRRDRLKA